MCATTQGRVGAHRRHPTVAAMLAEPLPTYEAAAAASAPAAAALPAARHPGAAPAPRDRPPPGDERYTIVVNTFRRHEALEGFLRHYESCPNVDAIHVVWSEGPDPPTREARPELYSAEAEVTLHGMPTTSFNNRFLPLPGIRTAGVLSIDDDILAPCGALDAAHAAWRRHPRQLVGFFPRHYSVRWDEGRGECAHGYAVGPFGSLDPARALGHDYSIVLTKGCFLHRDWLAVYTERLPREMLDYVRDHRNCEDLAMQFLVSAATGEAPRAVLVAGLRDEGARGGRYAGSAVSVSKGHYAERSRCVREFVRVLGGRNPLRHRTAGPEDAPAGAP